MTSILQTFIASHANSEIGFVQSDDSTKIYYKLTKPPKTTTKIPIVVYVYGGPGVQKVKNEWSSMVVQLFAQNGFGVLSSTIEAHPTEEEALNNPSISRWVG